MTETRVKFSTIVKNQFPTYVESEYPLAEEFFSQYYKSQEYQGAPIDLLENIDKYVKLDNNSNIIDSTNLTQDVDFFTTTIEVVNTFGFPDSYGLIKIDDEIITYTSKTNTSFVGCVRGFSGITSYFNQNNPEELVFSQSEVAEHPANINSAGIGKTVYNLSALFLKEFFRKTKIQIAPGFENREFYDNKSANLSDRLKLNQSIFIKQLKNFYQTRGTDLSFQILFKALYNENVEVVKPREFLFRPSDAHYRLTKDIIVEKISGNPLDLRNSTLFQDEYSDTITKAYAPITRVEKIYTRDQSSEYYKLSLDSDYDRDIIVRGAIYGQFSVHPFSKVIGNYPAESTYIDVDSTVGFPLSGELRVTYSNGDSGIVRYTSKNLNQFVGCTNITGTISDKSTVVLNTYAYGRSTKDGSEIRVRVTPVFEDFRLLEETNSYEPGDNINIETLGINAEGAKFNNWFLNITPTYEVSSFEITNTSNNIGLIKTKSPAIFKVNDSVTIIDSNNVERSAVVIDVKSADTFSIVGQGNLPSNATYKIKRNLLKVNSTPYPESSFLTSNVQNIYSERDSDGTYKALVAASSIPNYGNQPLVPANTPVVFSGEYPRVGLASTDIIQLKTVGDHGFYTGDAVYYTPEKLTVTSPEGFTTTTILSSLGDNIPEGLYFVKRLDQYNIKLARSRSNIFDGIFATINSNVSPNRNKIEKYDLKGQTLESQKLLRELSPPSGDGYQYETVSGQTGILINGVEILNYKSRDSVYYGSLNRIDVISPGSNYDVVNPPLLEISDTIGTGATGYCSVSGFLEEVRVVNSGFDYIDTPIIKITGGNGQGAKAYANMKFVSHDATFNSSENAKLVGVGATLSTIGFSTYHKFRNHEKVIYNSNGQLAIGGLINNSIYYVNTIDSHTVKLHKTEDDSIVGVNTITLTSYGLGNHTLQSFDKKSILSSIQVADPGFGYQNKKRVTGPSGINTASDVINIINHDFNSGEIVKYVSQGTQIQGLTSGNEYYVTKLDKDNFRLSLVGTGNIQKDYYYKTNQYINLTSVGVGTHVFNYPDISVEVIGSVGVSSVSGETFQATIQPIFRGEITSIHISNPGVGYGSSEIINFYREPLVTVNSGQDAELTAIVSSDGRIKEILVDKQGKNYFAAPDLEIIGDGVGAVLTPILSGDGRILEVKVIEPGLGYSPRNTFVNVLSAGSGAKFKSVLQSWTVNNFSKYLNNIGKDDGVIVNGLNDSFGLQYSHLYAPRKLRESIFSVGRSGETLYGIYDLRKNASGEEVDNVTHSPIIGWAYDGNPIYGPYGYGRKTGGDVKQLISGYVEEASKKENRPSLSIFPPEFFVEDFTYVNSSSDLVLDENNGRFCVTPEFPNGTYAYFTTLNSSPDSSGTFAGYKKPVFPYLIGKNYYSKPIDFNFKKNSNQDDIDLNETNWKRNTYSYGINSSSSLDYEYISIPNNLNQKIEVKSSSRGSIKSIGIVSEGINYRIGDRLIFNEAGTGGFGAYAEVSRLTGKPVSSISIATSSISNVQFYPSDGNGNFTLFANNPHNFVNTDIISVSGLSTTNSLLEGSYTVGITTGNRYILNVGVGSTSTTGIVTYFQISGDFSYPNLSENDILSVENEKVKVLNIDPSNSRIRVLRSVSGTVGIGSSHSSNTVLYQDERKLKINVGYNTTFNYRVNRELYFNPAESVAIGTQFGVGIGFTLSFSNPGFGATQIFVPTKSIYIPNHGLNTGDELIYSVNGGSSIQASTNGITTISLQNNDVLYVAKISDDLIGISTVKVGLGSTGTFVGISSTTSNSSTLFFTSSGSGVYHSFKTNYDNVVTGQISRNTVTVSTASTHGLSNNDRVFIDVNPSIATTIRVVYNDACRRVLIDPKQFSSGGVSTSTGTITISNHGFYNGQKVVHTSSGITYGLNNNEIYYVIYVDPDRFKLASSLVDSINKIPSYVGISSAYSGAISKVNPQIKLYRNSTVTFDLSDPSLSFTNQFVDYSAFDLDFYVDENFTQKYESSKFTDKFDVDRFGEVGISTDARVELLVNENTPERLFYKLNLVNENLSTTSKKGIIVDDLVPSNNELTILTSDYNGSHDVLVSSNTSFTYTLPKIPEKSSYTSTTSILKYDTDSLNALGGISSIRIKNNGIKYKTLPGISSQLDTLSGEKSILSVSANGNGIGSVTSYKIKDIGFDLPSDYTLRPTTNLPQICKIDPLYSFESIGVASFGRGYISSPKLIVLDGKTNKVVPGVDLAYNLGNPKVEIRKNTYGLNNVKPLILPINNSNGVGISSIAYNQSTKDVTVFLSVGFSTQNSFPFSVNDRVLIENVSVGVGSTGKGYDSKNYGYSLFTVNSVVQNLGGYGSVTYNLTDYLSPGEFPGTFDANNSSGRIIPEKHLVKFNSVLKSNSYLKGEKIISPSLGEIGIAGNWNEVNNTLKVESSTSLKVGDVLKGGSSFTEGIIFSVEKYDSEIKVGYYSTVTDGWFSNYGFLNDNLQRIQDNEYYQSFSYSLKSRVDYDKWDDAVSSLNHTAGYKKFGDLQVESVVAEKTERTVGIPTNVPNIDITVDALGVADLNCVYDFDLARENNIVSGSSYFSDEIIFSSRILTDYSESVGNRVLLIDDISDEFNSYPRPTPFSVVNTFPLSKVRAQKYITFVTDRRYVGQRQLLLVDLIHDNTFGYLNQYGRVETQYDQGSFDFTISGTEGQLLFYPTKYAVNDYNITCLSYNLDDNLLGTGSTNIGGIALIDTNSIPLAVGVTTTIVGIASTYTSLKILVEISPDINSTEFEFNEISVVHNGTDIELLEYGQLSTTLTTFASSGLGTYHAYFSGSDLNVDFVPNSGVGIGTTGVINTIQVALASSSYSGIGTVDIKHSRIEARTTSIASSTSPGIHTIAQYPETYDAAYFIVQVTDTTNNECQLSEVIVVDDYPAESGSSETYFTEYAVIQTPSSSSFGEIGTRLSAGGIVELTFTPAANINTNVNVYMNALRHQDDTRDIIDFNNGTIETTFSRYDGTERDIRRSFNIQHQAKDVFQRNFLGNSSAIVDVTENTIKFDEHFFVTGEEIIYTHSGAGSTQAIGIATTSFAGIGTTDKLPSSVYIVKVNDSTVKLASSAQNALLTIPNTLDLVSVGIGTSHTFTSKNQNQKVIISIDNLIQSPIVSTALTSTLSSQAFTTDDFIFFTGITSFFGGDLIKVDNEIMKINSVGVGSTNSILVQRGWMGTPIVGHSTGSLVTKVEGNYNIVDNTLNFVEAPYGNIPLSTSTNAPDERDWTGITTHSKFQGRVFLRSGIPGSSNETYYKNYIFDDISSNFNGIEKDFVLKSNKVNVSGIQNENAIVLINDIFQGPGLTYDYTLSETAGITTLSFTGSASSTSYDPNNASVPVGGVIVSVGSTEGFGYQPLISAGGTATVSLGGTIANISIGNSGSGYRGYSNYQVYSSTSNSISVGSTIISITNKNSVFKILQLNYNGSNATVSIGTYINSNIISVGSTTITISTGSTSAYQIPANTSVKFNLTNPSVGFVNVSVGKTDLQSATLEHIGIATILNGKVISPVFITNPGSGYTAGISTISDSPYVIFDSPRSYSDIPLIYSSSSVSGVGTQATIDIVVGQGSSVVDFELKYLGYGYGQGEILTVPIGGVTGIPTTTGYKEFQIDIQKTYSDKFTGWSVGQLQVLDNFDNLFDGEKKVFPIKISGNLITIRSSPGSNIDIKSTLLIFINDVLQVPGEGYIFEGGSVITFTEAPKSGDTSKVIFYRGSGSVDVIDRNILETVKTGDEITLGYDSSVGQNPTVQEEARTVTSVNSTDLVETNPYFGPGNVDDETLLRPVTWCVQTEDKIINGIEVGKDRELYEPVINPVAYVIQNVGIGSTIVYVDNLRPFFDAKNENDTSLEFQNYVSLISQNVISGAAATAVVSAAGTITSIVISDGGSGYVNTPSVSIGNVIGIGTTATATASITSGVVTSITISNAGSGYTSTNPPVVLISPPVGIEETNLVSSYSGDSGIIVGFGTTTQSSDDKLILDFYIPQNSFLRNASLVGTAITLSGISTGDYFVISDSNVGYAGTSLDINNNIIGVGTEFLDNVYQVDTVTTTTTNIIGIGTTHVRRVYARIFTGTGIGTITNFSSTLPTITFDSTSPFYTFDGTSNVGGAYTGVIQSLPYFGSFSWGKIQLSTRIETNSFSFYGDRRIGVSGITTSAIVKRKNPLKFRNYLV